MKKTIIGIALVAGMAFSLAISGAIIMLAWNTGISPALRLGTITFWQAVLFKVFVAAILPVFPSRGGR